MNVKRFIKVFLTVFIAGTACLLYARSFQNSADFYAVFSQDTLNTEDSAAAAKRRADSIASYRSYIKSKRYNDSVDAWRKRRMDSIRTANQERLDSMKIAQQRMLDSANAERQRKSDSLQAYISAKQLEKERHIDSLNAVRQVIIDSMNAEKKYRNSRKYKDSVAREQKARIDSMKAVQQARMDSLMAARQVQLDSLNTRRQQQSDSLQAHIEAMREAQEKRIDSLKALQAARMDSLNKLKEQREDELAQQEDEMRDKKRQMIEEKIQKEREAYTNEKFLKKKWSFLRRVLQNTTTRYNYFFNAKNKMAEAEDNMYRSKVDNLDSLITLLPFDPDIDSMKLKSDMDSLVRRISVGIQIHDPRVKWQDDLYLLLGKSYYYKGDYENAAATFQYIVSKALEEEKKEAQKKKNKTPNNTDLVSAESNNWLRHQPAKNDAILWLSRVYTQQRQFVQAQTLLDMVRSSKNRNPRLNGELEEAYARFYLAQGMPLQALPYLDSMTQRKTVDERARHRSGFLAAQLYEREGNYDKAKEMYDIVLGLHPPMELDFKASINRLIADLRSGNSDLNAAVRSLERLTREEKFRNFQDQIYYELGGVQAQLNELQDAEQSYLKGIRVPNAQTSVKGKSFYNLAEIYYNSNRFVEAKAAYDSALALLTPEDKPMYAVAQQRASGLSSIAIPGAKVQALDSILRLTSLTESERKDWAKNELRRIREQANTLQVGGASNNAMMNATGDNWYFNNESLASKGESDFKARWGNRTRRDNWRRSQGLNTGSQSTGTETEIVDETEALTEADLIARIPIQAEVIDSLHQARATAYYDLGHAFFIAQDFPNAEDMYHRLTKNYPSYPRMHEVWYDQYLMALGENNLAAAEAFKERILAQYPDSETARRIAGSNTQSVSNAYSDDEINLHLDETYQMLNLGMFDEVIRRSEDVKNIFPIQSPRYMNKYVLMRAIATAGQGNYSKADSMLNEIITVNSNDSLTRWAQSVRDYLQANMSMMQTALPESGGTTFLNPNIVSQTYDYQPNTTHYVMVYTRNFDGRFSGLRSGVVDYNSLSGQSEYSTLDVVMAELSAKESVFIVKEFANAAQARNYLQEIKDEKQLLSGYTNPSEISMTIISEQNYLLLLVQKKFADYLSFYFKNYR